MKDIVIPGPPWIPVFLAALAETKVVEKAARKADRSSGTVYGLKGRNPAFAKAWEEVIAGPPVIEPDETTIPTALLGRTKDGGWQQPFLANLAASSNVAASAGAVKLAPAKVYRLRRTNPDFAAKWRAALLEGYDHLEMEVVGYLRGSITDRKIDVPNAIRLLAAHRKTATEMRGITEEENEQDVLDSIDRTIERMKAEWEEYDAANDRNI